MLNKLFNNLNFSSNTIKSTQNVQPKRFMTMPQIKAEIAALPPQRVQMAYLAALKRVKPGHIPMTLRAMAELNLNAPYQGEAATYTRCADVFAGASQYANLCHLLPRGYVYQERTHKKLVDLVAERSKPKKSVRWDKNIVVRPPSPEFLAKAGRKAHS